MYFRNLRVHSTLESTFIIYKKSLKIPQVIIKSCKSKENRQHNCHKKKDKRSNNDLQNIHIKQKIEQYESH